MVCDSYDYLPLSSFFTFCWPKWFLKLQKAWNHFVQEKNMKTFAVDLGHRGPFSVTVNAAEGSTLTGDDRIRPGVLWPTRVYHARLNFCTCSIVFHHCHFMWIATFSRCFWKHWSTQSLVLNGDMNRTRRERERERKRKGKTHTRESMHTLWCNYVSKQLCHHANHSNWTHVSCRIVHSSLLRPELLLFRSGGLTTLNDARYSI